MKQRFVLVGPNQGKTIVLHGYPFVKGVLEVTAEDAVKLRAIFSRFYSAYPETEVTKDAEGRLVVNPPLDLSDVAPANEPGETPAPDAPQKPKKQKQQ